MDKKPDLVVPNENETQSVMESIFNDIDFENLYKMFQVLQFPVELAEHNMTAKFIKMKIERYFKAKEKEEKK